MRPTLYSSYRKFLKLNGCKPVTEHGSNVMRLSNSWFGSMTLYFRYDGYTLVQLHFTCEKIELFTWDVYELFLKLHCHGFIKTMPQKIKFDNSGKTIVLDAHQIKERSKYYGQKKTY